MSQRSKKFLQRLQNLYRSLFPKRIQLSQHDQQLLLLMFPNINSRHLRFYDGMPWYMLHTFATATALPGGYSRAAIHIYFRDYEAGDFYTLVTLVHEVYHAQQYRDLAKKTIFEWGYFRAFIWHYLGWVWAIFFSSLFKKRKTFQQSGYDAYRQHPMEIPAYKHEDDFGYAYRNFLNENTDLALFFQKNPFLVRHNSGYGNMRPPYWAMGFSMLIAIFLSCSKPLLELLLFVLLWPIVLIFGKGSKK